MISLEGTACLDTSIGEASKAGELLAACRVLDRRVKVYVGTTDDGKRRLVAKGRRFEVERVIPLDASPSEATTTLLADVLKALQQAAFRHGARMQKVPR